MNIDQTLANIETETQSISSNVCKKQVTNDDEIIDNNKNSDVIEKLHTEKYSLLLKLINSILKNINGVQIDKLTDFVDIDRDFIIKDENKKLIFDNEKEFFPPYDKVKFAWSRRNCTRQYILSFIRYACNEVGLDFKSQKQKKLLVVEGVKYHKISMLYSIRDKATEEE